MQTVIHELFKACQILIYRKIILNWKTIYIYGTKQFLYFRKIPKIPILTPMFEKQHVKI